MDTGNSFPAAKQPEREADHLPVSSVEVKNIKAYASFSLYAIILFFQWRNNPY
jgi:hypothetical protein